MKRKLVSNTWLNRSQGWDVPFDRPLLIVRGKHEAFVNWNDKVIALSISVDVMDPETCQIYHAQPACDFDVIES